MSIIMDQSSTNKQNFFQKSPEMSFAESPALSLFKGFNSKYLGDTSLKLSKQHSNTSIRRPSPCISSLAPTPRYDPLSFLTKNPSLGILDSKQMKSIKLDFVPFGSPEINFVLGPSAIEIAAKKSIEQCNSIFDKHTKGSAEDMIAIKHIQSGGPTIYVSNKRVKRILKRRKKRVEFLLNNPEFSLPYKFRNKGPKHQSRSKSAKGRKRKGDGRFARAANMGQIDFQVSIDDLGYNHNEEDGYIDDILRDKL